MEELQLLRLQPKHRSSEISDEVLKCKHINPCEPLSITFDLLKQTGFDRVSSIQSYRIDPALITALVERWRPETHTFHLPSGECTVTLEYVAIQLGLNVNGLSIRKKSEKMSDEEMETEESLNEMSDEEMETEESLNEMSEVEMEAEESLNEISEEEINSITEESLSGDVESGIGTSYGNDMLNGEEEIDFHEIDFDVLTEDEVKKFKFLTNEAVYEFYRLYAIKKGFGIRKYHTRRGKDGEILWQSMVCDREGFREIKDNVVKKRAPRKVTRCGCLARLKIHIDKENGGWYVSTFDDEHNHQLVGDYYGGMIASNRRMTETDIGQVNTMRELGHGTGKIFGSFAAQCGHRYIGFCRKDMYNQIQKQRRIGEGDAIEALKYLNVQSKSDRFLYWRHTLDAEGKLQHLFWADGCSRYDYSIFGDVLAFDTTYGRNKYKFPVVVFSGINHHKQSTVFAAAVVSDETEQTYVWLLQQFLDAMNSKQPICVMTDGDLSMKNAIKRVFPDAYHRLCAWHICNNAGKNIKKKQFHQDFKKVMYADVEVEDFNGRWEELITKHGLQNNRWAIQTFDSRSMWARSHIRGKFFAGLHTTSRCEALHSQLGRYVESGYNLTEFLQHFQRLLSHIRNNEVVEDFNSSYGDEVLQTPYPALESYADSLYTRSVFKDFVHVLMEAAKMRINSTKQTSSQIIYKVGKHYKCNKDWHVCYSAATVELKCSCRGMESFGIACCHIVCVLLNLDMTEIPKCLVLKRWTKKAKEPILLNMQQCHFSNDTVYNSRYGAMSDGCRVLCSLASKNEEDFREMLEKIYNECDRLRTKETCSEPSTNVTEGQLKDPNRVRTKGRVAGSSSKRKHVYQCGVCHEVGHNRQNCPNDNHSP